MKQHLFLANASNAAFGSKAKGQSFGGSENETSLMYSDYHESRHQSKGDQSSKVCRIMILQNDRNNAIPG